MRRILLIWAAAAIPMGILGWLVAPALAGAAQKPGLERLAVVAHWQEHCRTPTLPQVHNHCVNLGSLDCGGIA